MLILRQYWPQEPALNGSWVPQAVRMVGPATTAITATYSAKAIGREAG